MNRESAEVLALQALAWLLGNDELLPVFMGSSGVDADTLRVGAETPEVQQAVLDFIMLDDAWVVAFCDTHGHAYDSLFIARQSLPGGEDVQWT